MMGRLKHFYFEWNVGERTYKSFESNEELEDYVLENQSSDSEYKIVTYGIQKYSHRDSNYPIEGPSQ